MFYLVISNALQFEQFKIDNFGKFSFEFLEITAFLLDNSSFSKQLNSEGKNKIQDKN